MPAASIAFSTHTWTGLLKHVLQMALTDAETDERLNWTLLPHTIAKKQIDGARSNSDPHKVLSALVILRGNDLSSTCVGEGAIGDVLTQIGFFQKPLYASWMCASAAKASLPATQADAFSSVPLKAFTSGKASGEFEKMVVMLV
jgi:tubulin delta